MTETNKSEVEIAESTVEGRVEMAAAEASFDAIGLLNKAVRASGRSQKEIAEALGVGESRVSQVLSGDGSLRISTLARYLRAAGYDLKLEALPADPGVADIPKPRSRKRRDAEARQSLNAARIKCWESPVMSSAGVGSAYTFHASAGAGHVVVIGERTSVDPRKIPSAVTEWAISKTYAPDVDWAEPVKSFAWSKPSIPMAWDMALSKAEEAVAAAAAELDRKYADH